MSVLDDIDPTEPILPELAPYLHTDGPIPLVSHPLVHTILPMPYMVNRQYEHAVERLARAEAERSWGSWVHIHAKPYRMNALHELVMEGRLGRGDEPLITELLIDVWTGIENVWQVHEQVEDLIDWLDRATVEADPFMASLPDALTVYRGHQDVNAAGYSWTTDRVKAQWFAARFRGEGQVSERTVSKADILFATDMRGEKEVVIRP